jgi:hypothetical protein
VLVQREMESEPFPVREYIAISTTPVWKAQTNVVAGGQASLLKLVSKRNQVGLSPDSYRC